MDGYKISKASHASWRVLVPVRPTWKQDGAGEAFFIGRFKMNNEDVVVKYQAQIEVYPSQSGYVVLKQECMFEEPSVIDILPEHINAIVDALLAAKNFLLNEAE